MVILFIIVLIVILFIAVLVWLWFYALILILSFFFTDLIMCFLLWMITYSECSSYIVFPYTLQDIECFYYLLLFLS